MNSLIRWIIKGIFLLRICSCLVLTGQAQTVGVKTQATLERLKQYEQDRPVEKVYLHLDRSYYVAGEDIWFKAYVTVGQFNFLSAISGILYVELIDDEDRVLQSERLPLMSGLSMGDFKLPDTLSEGNYRVRAYTNWMRNFGASYFFDKPIVIGNSFSKGLLTSSKFQFDWDEKQRRRVQVDILVKDGHENPIANREVSYELTWNGKKVDKGKKTLDGQGLLHLSFIPRDTLAPFQGKITLELREKEEVIQKTISWHQESFSPSFQLIPEGGVLLANVFNKMGFRATDEFGRGTLVSGYLEEDGVQIAPFSSDSMGMGSLSFTPLEGKSYRAVVDFGAGKKIEQTISPARQQGYALAVNNAMEKAIWIQVSQSPAQVTSGKELLLIAQHNGELFYVAKTRTDKTEVTVNIDRNKLPIGLVNLLLVDEQMHLLAGRSLFNPIRDGFIPLRIETDKSSYKAREKVSFKLNTDHHRDSILTGSFSMSVTNVSKLPDSALTSSNILSTLLLSAGAREYVQYPGQYFPESGMDPERNDRLDRLLLGMRPDTSSWNAMVRYAGDSISYPAEKSLAISGRVTKGKSNPVNKARVTVISPQNNPSVMDTLTQADGHFSFEHLTFFDSTNFVVQARDAKGRKNVDIRMDSVPNQRVSPNPNAPDRVWDVNEALGTFLPASNKSLQELERVGLLQRSIQLKEVEITAKKENPAKHSSNLNGPGNADQVISGDESWFGACPTLEMCLTGRLVGVIFRNGVPYSTRSPNQPMQVVLDGMYMDASSSPLSMVNPADVASIEVLRNVGNTAIYGMYGGGGVLIITTRRGDQPRKFPNELYTPGIVSYKPQGFYQMRVFRSPDYSQEEEKPGMKDFRTTIYWNPDLLMSKEGSIDGFFYTADEPGVYQIILEGLDVEGHLGRAVRYIQVNK